MSNLSKESFDELENSISECRIDINLKGRLMNACEDWKNAWGEMVTSKHLATEDNFSDFEKSIEEFRAARAKFSELHGELLEQLS
jgi:hypothetical protein